MQNSAQSNGVSFLNQGSTGFFGGIDNWWTGNKDWQRQVLMSDREMSFNAAEAQKARDYSTEMSNTQYQRAVKDMQSAGLNPYLAYGSHSSVPSATTASIGSRGVGSSGRGAGDMFRFLGGLATSAISAASKAATAATNATSAVKVANLYTKGVKIHEPLDGGWVERRY